MPQYHDKLWKERGAISSTRAHRRLTGDTSVIELTEEEMERQDRETAALREVESPLYDPFTSPWTADEDARRRLLAAAGVPAPRPKDRPEPWQLVEPERQALRRGIRYARRLTPEDMPE
ncbi:MAG TPA: hypothetical protein VNN79_07275 [Actinomycetota bacterium]|nr:hypothetical protein [Actinomycetota bacterium]